MLHTGLIVVHSIAGVASFAAGVLSLRLRHPGRGGSGYTWAR